MPNNDSLTVMSRGPEETLSLGRIIGANAEKGTVIALIGDLGAGKTCLTQGIAEGLGVGRDHYVTSPTFTLINEYSGRMPLYHMDVYRLDDATEMEELGYEDYFYGDGVVVVEWAEKIKELMPDKTLVVTIVHEDINARKIVFKGGARIIACLRKNLKGGGFV